MNPALYPWVNGLHVAAALVFAGGVLGVGVFLAAVGRGGTSPVAGAVRRWDGRITVPAMLLVWALGLTLAISGSWFTQGWLQAKFLIVVALSGLHGIQSGLLRRLARGEAPGGAISPWLPVAGFAAIAMLAVVKPG